MKTMTREMKKALEYMETHEGTLYLRTDGLWSDRILIDGDADFLGPKFSTSTMQRLVGSGLADYVCFCTATIPEYPIEIRVRNIKFVPTDELLAEARKRGIIK
jgi:hypothetical protein